MASLRNRLEQINRKHGGIGALIMITLLVALLYYAIAHILADVF